jgi:hypothetical protein
MEQIQRLFDVYQDLFARCRQTAPDLVETAAMASVLHSFYTGLEHIFLVIAKEVDRSSPTGPKWHRDLLTQMAQRRPNRSQVISMDAAHLLADYLGFRHVYRHSYSFFLDWDELEKLVTPVQDVWRQVRQELEAFLNSLSSDHL